MSLRFILRDEPRKTEYHGVDCVSWDIIQIH